MSNIICYDSDNNVLKTLYQWDNNQTMTVRGVDMPPTPVFHFCNRLSNLALVVSPTVSGTDLIVKIPNILLQQAEPIIAYLYQNTDDNSYRTMHAIHIPVIPRPKPDDYEYDDNIDYISIVILNSRLAELERYINTEAVDGLYYEDNMLYLTSNGEIVSDPVEIVGGGGGGAGVRFEVVNALPATGEVGVIYLVPNSGGTPNIYDEYIWVNNTFEMIGTTEIDLSNYYTKDELSAIFLRYYTKDEVDALLSSYSTTSEVSAEIAQQLGSYYTKTQVDGYLQNKQDNLTAGADIDITNDTISVEPNVLNLGTITAPSGTYTTTITSEQLNAITPLTIVKATVNTAPIAATLAGEASGFYIFGCQFNGFRYEVSVNRSTRAVTVTETAIPTQLTAGSGIAISNNAISVSGMPYLTAAPLADNTDGTLKFVVLTAEPATRYEGYVYLIVEPTLISFTIGSQPYQAEDGMTWAEWVNSEYNTGGFVEFSSGIFDHLYDRQVYLVGDPVAPTDTIYDSSAYSLRQQ